MDRRGRVAAQEVVDVVVPHHAAVGGGDHTRLQRADESAVGGGEVGGVVERQRGQVLGMGCFDDGVGGLCSMFEIIHQRLGLD